MGTVLAAAASVASVASASVASAFGARADPAAASRDGSRSRGDGSGSRRISAAEQRASDVTATIDAQRLSLREEAAESLRELQARSLVITPCRGGCGPKGSLDHLLPAFYHPPSTYLLPATRHPLTHHPRTYCSLHTYLLATYYSGGLQAVCWPVT